MSQIRPLLQHSDYVPGPGAATDASPFAFRSPRILRDKTPNGKTADRSLSSQTYPALANPSNPLLLEGCCGIISATPEPPDTTAVMTPRQLNKRDLEHHLTSTCVDVADNSLLFCASMGEPLSGL